MVGNSELGKVVVGKSLGGKMSEAGKCLGRKKSELEKILVGKSLGREMSDVGKCLKLENVLVGKRPGWEMSWSENGLGWETS